MLIEFAVANYRSIRAKQTLSMVAGAARELPHNTVESGSAELGRINRSAAIYGPNAAGKTNLLRAVQFMQRTVVSSATVIDGVMYDPFKFSHSTREAPSQFEVTFLQNGTRYEYGFAASRARVNHEWLIEYPHGRGRKTFERIYDERTEKYDWTFSTHFKGNRVLWRDSTRPNALFLSTAMQLNSDHLKPVFEWFQRRLVVIAGGITLNPILTLQLLEQSSGKERILPFLREADPGILDLTVHKEALPQNAALVLNPAMIIENPKASGSPPNLVRVTFSHASDNKDEMVPLDIAEEANGTQALFRGAGAWLNVFANGEILLVDEIDASLHPVLTRFLISQFHSAASNPNNSQLIFSTHNTTFLTNELFRRDQIWFVEKAEDGGSRLFPLLDFSPRNDENIERWYLRGRYGALPIFSEPQ